MSNSNRPLALVIGAGEGLGASIMNVFHEDGYQVVGFDRSLHKASHKDCVLKELDCVDQQGVVESMRQTFSEYGAPQVVVLNTAQLTIKPFLETTVNDFELAWQSMVLSAFNVMQQALPLMLEQQSGTVIVSGATGGMRGGGNFSAFASAKFALRGLTQSLAREYQKQGVHIAHVILDGIIDTPRSRDLHALDPAKMMLPADIAAEYLHLVKQNPSAWTHELDLRPHCENF